MPFTVGQIKADLGILPTDTTQDAAIGRLMDEILHACNTLLDRDLEQALVTETYYDLESSKLWLRRYPVQSVLSINGAAPGPEIQIHKTAGWLRGWPIAFATKVEVEYQGGYDLTGNKDDPMPPDLVRAMLEAFMSRWAESNQATGGPGASGGATIVQGSGEVKRVVVPEGFTIDYDVGAQAIGGSSQAALASQQAYWGWLAPWASVLQSYRSMRRGA